MKWLIRAVVLGLWFVSIVYVYGLGALAGKYAPHLAEKSMARASKVMFLFMGDYQPCGDTPVLECGFQDTTGRREVACADYLGDGAAVLMTFGQSNSANAGRDRYTPSRTVANFNFHDGKCYVAQDPLLGPDGQGGAVWGVLADKLIEGGKYDRVMIAPFGIGGSALAQWQADGFLHPILVEATRSAVEHGIEPTHVLWHQGESDAGSGTSEQDYFAMFEKLLELEFQPQQAYYYLGAIAEEQGKPDRAMEWYRKVGEGDHWLEVQIRLARLEAGDGDVETARERLRKLRFSQPNQALSLIHISGPTRPSKSSRMPSSA